MKLTMFGAKGGPKLKGPAGLIRSFGKPLHAVWLRHWDRTNMVHKHIELCLRAGNEMEAVLDAHPDDFALPGSQYVL